MRCRSTALEILNYTYSYLRGRINGSHYGSGVARNNVGELTVPLREILYVLKILGDELDLLGALALKVDLVLNGGDYTLTVGYLGLIDIEAECTRDLYRLELYSLCLCSCYLDLCLGICLSSLDLCLSLQLCNLELLLSVYDSGSLLIFCLKLFLLCNHLILYSLLKSIGKVNIS